MSTEKITAESRTEFGKGAARRIRRADKVPAVIYGHGDDPVHVTLPGHATMMALKHLGANALLELEIDGTSQLALTKQVQVDPIRRVLEHIDFVAVIKGEKVTVEVPVQLVGEADADTLVVMDITTIQIEVDIQGATAGTQIQASDLKLPEGSTLLLDGDVLIVNITEATSVEQADAELAQAESDAGIERDASDAQIAAAAE
jgi:large subunit ribosomal protein L25